MTKKRQRQPSGRGRLSWDGRLWDPSGHLYTRAVLELDRAAVVELLRDLEVQVAVSSSAGPLRWLDQESRMTTWKLELEPHFHDQPNWQPPSDDRGRLPFHAELWRCDDRQVLLLTDRD